MKYELTKPCPHCPFRSDIKPYLTPDRVEEIMESLERSTFTCHLTTVSDEDGDDCGEMRDGPNAQHCAGALILQKKEGESSQMTRIAGRLGMFDPRRLEMDSPVFDSWSDMISAQDDE